MSKQGAPAQPPRPDDGWWDTVYDGPAGTLPDTPDADPGDGSVDDWFDTAAGLIGQQRSGEEPAAEPEPEPGPGPGPEPVAVPEVVVPEPDGRDSIDDWFDTAVGVIGGAEGIGRQRTSTETHQFRAPSFADDAPEPVAAPEPEPEPEPISLQKPEPPQVPEAPDVPEAPEAPDVPEAPEAPEALEAPVPAPDLAPEPEPDHAPVPEPDPEPVQPTAPAPATATIPDPRLAVRAPLADGGAPVPHVGERPPTYGPEPTAVPEADPGSLRGLVPDTVLEGAQYGPSVLRAVSVRGDSARYRGEPRRDSLLVTRFGDGPDGLLLAVLGGFDRTGGAAEDAVTAEAVAVAADEACRQLAAAIGRSRAGLAADLRDGARDRLRYGLQRLATSAAAPLRALAPREEGGDPQSPAALHCLMVSLDPAAGYRAAFGVGPGGLYLLRAGHWIDAYAARLLHHPDGQPPVAEAPVPDPRPFRFRLVPATPGDILLLCTPGLAAPIADEPAVAHFLSTHWTHPHPPGTIDFLRQVQVRAKGYADDRTAAAIWTE
ncbi:protein phosphatase 2C-like protein [Streptomyces sp. 1114.5]|uniref:protein phosphatase 2C domain-containing protein n=1 Tax=Streptomyces sp. 1114.5 TaxID=1938830 RepID=UPI000EAEBB22|nr:protein phosphatase 2C domain-containing protein [Streptomyces sp. 1114.5]RKT18591.1 protein phosphatase 2C-like protein [Streptomyces sp. 1114.5]